MKLASLSENVFISALRFFAHLFSLLLTFVIVLLVLGEGLPGKADSDIREVLLSASLFIMLVGLITAWKWEGYGGILIIIGFAAFFAANSFFTYKFNLGFFFLLFPFTGLLYLLCCWRDK